MKNTVKKEERHSKVEAFHEQSKYWESELRFIRDELKFISHLLNSYIFEPNTPNLFERLQDYQQQLRSITEKEGRLNERINKHEKDLGGMLECTDDLCDTAYYEKHLAIEEEVNQCLWDFKILKSEIFNYAGGILKQRKPDATD